MTYATHAGVKKGVNKPVNGWVNAAVNSCKELAAVAFREAE